jgi:hypothetical protein
MRLALSWLESKLAIELTILPRINSPVVRFTFSFGLASCLARPVLEISVEFASLFGPRLLHTQFLDQPHGLALETAVNPTTGSRVKKVAQLIGAEVQQTIGESFESTLAHIG